MNIHAQAGLARRNELRRIKQVALQRITDRVVDVHGNGVGIDRSGQRQASVLTGDFVCVAKPTVACGRDGESPWCRRTLGVNEHSVWDQGLLAFVARGIKNCGRKGIGAIGQGHVFWDLDVQQTRIDVRLGHADRENHGRAGQCPVNPDMVTQHHTSGQGHAQRWCVF